MARRQQNDYMPTAQDVPRSNGLRLSSDRPTMADEEPVSDVDEPPDEKIRFPRLVVPNNRNSPPGYARSTTPSLQHNGNPSLLTQALLTTPDSTPWSDAEAPLLTSDGGLTSPARTNTPSPPLPTANITGLALPTSKVYAKSGSQSDIETTQLHQDNESTERPAEKSVEAGLGRRRCITFACGRQTGTSTNTNSKPADHSVEITNSVVPSKRQCTLRFACPTKPSLDTIRQTEQHSQPLEPPQSVHYPLPSKICTIVPSSRHRDSPSSLEKCLKNEEITGLSKPSVLNRPDLELSEATRFHEFAGSFNVDDEWMNEQTAHRQKITVNDTLRKENAIRKLAQEADEEALEEDEQGVGSLGNDDEDDDNFDSDEEASDGGNETDDEEGFADSDDDSEHGSQYQFWTPGLTTAATSVDQIEHPRPWTHRVTSESSIESMINTRERVVNHSVGTKRTCKSQRAQNLSKMRPGTPNLPDSTDFVCGTLDEDRPLEAAFMSCLEERRRSKHKTIPQDIDPSFPTSDPDAEEDDVDVDDDDNATQTSDEQVWVMGRLDNFVDEDQAVKSRRDVSRRIGKSPMPSPKRPRSPAPLRRGAVHRSPPPRQLFGQSPNHLRSPYTVHQKLKSPPSTRRTSFCISPRQKFQGFTTSNLAQRPHLTHTTSLPRTPNPFWRLHREAHDYGSDAPSGIGPATTADYCSRGPIDIVKGLESRRQRRKEKLWRQHCRYAAKDKDRRCQPGKGAERMRELGLEMANKVRDYGQKAALVLSV